MTRSRVRLAHVAAAAIAATVLAAGSSYAARAAPAASARTAADAENGFALSLLAQLARDANVVYSPYSVATALTMADAGARGRTAAQMNGVLGAGSTAAAVANSAALRHALAAAVSAGRDAPTLAVANALWTQRGLPLAHPFVATLGTGFGAPPQQTDFAAAPEPARQAINAWVSRHTARIIPTLLPAGSVSAATRFVLANAIYLKARWSTPFERRLTHPRRFTTAAGQHVDVPFMSTKDAALRYAAGHGFQAVDLPYLSSSLSLLAILPRGESLAQLERTLSAGTLAHLAGSLADRRVNLELPKLHLHTQTALNGPLEALGMTAAFTPAADFGAITTKAPLQISLVEHAADLRVYEAGTVAAGATAIIGPTAIEQPRGTPVTVTFDHPFLVLLRDDSSGVILFAAQVANPGAS